MTEEGISNPAEARISAGSHARMAAITHKLAAKAIEVQDQNTLSNNIDVVTDRDGVAILHRRVQTNQEGERVRTVTGASVHNGATGSEVSTSRAVIERAPTQGPIAEREPFYVKAHRTTSTLASVGREESKIKGESNLTVNRTGKPEDRFSRNRPTRGKPTQLSRKEARTAAFRNYRTIRDEIARRELQKSA